MTTLEELCKKLSRKQHANADEAIYHSEIAPLAFTAKIQFERLEKQHAIALRALKEISFGYANKAAETADAAISKIDECN